MLHIELELDGAPSVAVERELALWRVLDERRVGGRPLVLLPLQPGLLQVRLRIKVVSDKIKKGISTTNVMWMYNGTGSSCPVYQEIGRAHV